ncbi:MAG: sulfatase-like hydrolase/transferase [Vicinamibacteria bacterium]
MAKIRSGGTVVLLIAASLAVAFVLTRRPSGITRNPKLSVLLITIDTLRADAIGAYGNTSVQTPWMDRLAKEGVRFDSAHAHNVVTFPSHSNILSGQYPLLHGVRDNTGFRFPANVPTLATRLKEQGLRTGAFVSAFVLDSRFGLDRGFDIYDDQTAGVDRQTPFVVPDRRGEQTVARAVHWIDSQPDQPFFAFVHLYDPHFPYQPKEPFAARHKDDPYFGEVEAADAALEALLKPILDGPRGADTLVILTSDHGEGLGEHGESTHGIFAYESTLHIPLIARMPGLVNKVVAEPVRHIDIVPTVLDALGTPIPSDLPGRSLWSLATGGQPEPGFSSYFESLSASLNQGWAPLRGIFDGRFKYIDLPLPELYDIQADSHEVRNLAATEPVKLDATRALLTRQRAQDLGVKRADEDAATVERLRALGYVGASQAAPQKDRYTAADDPKNLITVDASNREVVTLFMNGKLEEAIALARKNLQARPDMAGAILQLAYLESARGNLKAAVDAARRAVQLKPLDSEALSLLGAYLTEMGRPDEAIKALLPYTKVAAPDFDVYTALGLAYAESRQPVPARAAFMKARETDPTNGMGLVNLGTLELMLGNRDAAQAALEHALELDDSIAKAYNTLGVIAAQEGRMPEAIARWRKSVELNPADYQTLFNLATTFERQGNLADARPYYEAYVRAAPVALEARDIARTKDWLSRHTR